MRRAPLDTYAPWEYAIFGVVVVLILGGILVLARIAFSAGGTDSAEPGTGSSAPIATAATSGPVSCPQGEWLDSATSTCLPEAACGPTETYDSDTNTCTAQAPALADLDPRTGTAAGGTKITFTGDGFVDGAVVTIGGAVVEDLRFVDARTITGRTPPSEVTFPVDVQVTNPDGQSAVLDNVFTYAAPEVRYIAEVVPATGSADGGEAVVIKGQDFADGAVVAFNGLPAKGVTVLNATTIRATTPAGPLGSVSVNVRNPDEGAHTLADAFTYVDQPPRVVSAVRPKEGAESGGTRITIVGSGFEKGADVTVGGKDASKVRVVSATRITAVTPAGSLGRADVAVRNPGVPAAILTKAFTYVEAPTITGVRPADGTESGGTKVTVTGAGFLKGATLTFNGVPATSVVVKDDATITAVTPPGAAGPATIVVTNPGQPPATATNAFTYTPAEVPTPTPSPTSRGR